jgi:uncharacterized RDD family membrane protein YckC
MDRPRASWLSGPEQPDSDPESSYPGQQLGLPPTGSRSLARMGRRLAALLVDWLIAYGLAGLAVTSGVVTSAALSTVVLGIWFVIGVVAVRLFGFTPGQWALGLAVVRLEGGAVLHVGVGRAAARGLLIALVIPPLFTDSDGRGLHDRITNTAVIRR